MVISTGTTVPRWLSVAALYCLQNSIVWTPWGLRAVPTGGAGVAFPASSWILTTARTRFFGAMDLSSSFSFSCFGCAAAGTRRVWLELGDLAELQLHRG